MTVKNIVGHHEQSEPLAAAGEQAAACTQARRPGSDIEAAARVAFDRGDYKETLTLLMHACGDALYRFCWSLVADDDLAAEIHQVTFVQAYRDLPTYSGRSTLRTWLFGIARHRALDALKSRHRWGRRFELVDQPPEKPGTDPQPDESLAARRLARILEDCLQQLRPPIRLAVFLRYREGMSYDEMAEICRAGAATLQARVSRALPVLRRCVERATTA